MPYFKINHQYELDWREDDNDLNTFIVIAVERVTDLGFSTYIYSNRKDRKAILSQYTVVGHQTLNPTCEFDVMIETGTTTLDESMKIKGKEALRTFLGANAHRPLLYSNLARILTATDAKSQEEGDTISLGYPSPGF